jgi:hypothetical protein
MLTSPQDGLKEIRIEAGQVKRPGPPRVLEPAPRAVSKDAIDLKANIPVWASKL